eukprot:g20592.t1
MEDLLRNMPEGSQEDLQAMAELMELKESDPAKFAAYAEMAVDAAKLAEEQPEAYQRLFQEVAAADEDNLSAARVEQKRAMDAVSELNRTTNGKTVNKEGKATDAEIDIKLPGGGTLGAGGAAAKDAPAGVVISPRPGFVLKTKLVDKGLKVFVNVCQHERIGESGMVKKLDKEGEEVEGLNIPMSVGPPSVDKDNAGQECIVYDVIINPKTVQECRKDRTGAQRDWVCHLAMQSVMAKHDCRLDPKYKLPKLTFKGDKDKGPAKQRVRDDSAKPQISEVKVTCRGSTSNGKAGSSGTGGGNSGSLEVPSASSEGLEASKKGSSGQAASTLPETSLTSTTMAVWECRGGNLGRSGGEGVRQRVAGRESDVSSTTLEETVRIPLEQWPDSLLLTATGVRKEALAVDLLAKAGVQVSAYECTIKIVDHNPLQVRLPYAVLPETASAQANSHDGTLAVRVSIDKALPSKRPDAGSKPWLLSNALEGGSGGRQGFGVGKATAGGARSTGGQGAENLDGDVGVGGDALPEERFHLKLPAGVNQYTGAAEGDDTSKDFDLLGQGQERNNRLVIEAGDEGQDDADAPIGEGEVLPEERFHRADVVSQQMIDTREKQRQEKIDRVEKEREERRKQPQDDGVEYVDFDDYRAGGKLGSPAPPPNSAPAACGEGVGDDAVRKEQAQKLEDNDDPKFCQDREAASRVLSEAVKCQDREESGSGGAAVGSRLSSAFWAELLD